MRAQEAPDSQGNYMSIICHDIERSIKWVYICALAIPFLAAGFVYVRMSFAHKGPEFSPDKLKLAVVFFFVACTFIVLAIRIKGFQYRLLIDKLNGRFSYQKDNLFGTSHVKGALNRIDEVYIKEASVFSDRISALKRTIYKIILRSSHQDLVIYVSSEESEAHSMAASLSGFLGVSVGQEGE